MLKDEVLAFVLPGRRLGIEDRLGAYVMGYVTTWDDETITVSHTRTGEPHRIRFDRIAAVRLRDREGL